MTVKTIVFAQRRPIRLAHCFPPLHTAGHHHQHSGTTAITTITTISTATMSASSVHSAASAAAAAAAPAAPQRMANASVLLMRGHSHPFTAELSGESLSAHFRHAYKVLNANRALCIALRVVDDNKGGLTVPDYALRDVFMLLRLHEWLRTDPRAPARLQVALLDEDHLKPWFRSTADDAQGRANLLFGHDNPAPQWHDLAVRRPGSASRSAASSSAGSASAASAHPSPVLQYRHCSSLADALQGDPLRVLFLPNLMWYSPCAGQSELEDRLRDLLRAVGQAQPPHATVHVYPPREWDERLENKDDVYHKFSFVMLPTVWLAVALSGQAESRLLEFTTTATWLVHQRAPGRYVLKASYSDSGRAVRTDINVVVNASGERLVPDRLLETMIEYNEKYNHIKFGLQPFVDDFPTNEFRHWYMALPDVNGARTFRLVAAVRSKFTGSPVQRLSGVTSSPLDTASIACYDLAQRIMTGAGAHDQQFIELRDDLLEMGCYALRVDCGYDSANNRAFLNELTAPADAAIFTHAHETELVWKLGEMLAEGVMELLRKQ